jgi:hypothetical protein
MLELSSALSSLMSDRRFPPPWTVEDHNDACFIVKDRNGYALAYVYYEEESGRRSAARGLVEEAAYCAAAAGLPGPNTMTFAPIGVRL